MAVDSVPWCVASGLGFFLWNKGASMTNAGTLAAFNNAVVPLAVVCSFFVFGEIEEIERSQLIRLLFGGATIVLSVWLTLLPKSFSEVCKQKGPGTLGSEPKRMGQLATRSFPDVND